MDALAQLSGFLLSTVLRAWAAGEKVSPTLVLETPQGREVQPYSETDVMTAIQQARSTLRQKVLSARRAVLLVPDAAVGTKSVTLEAAEFGDPMRELELRITRASAPGAPFKVSVVEVVRPRDLGEAQAKDVRVSFDQGVAEDARAAAVWTSAR